MIYTTNLKDAISFAISVHEVDQKQKRKGKNIAYIVHPLSVGLILSQAGANEDTIVAGILHDTIEDCKPYRSVTRKTIEDKFNSDVARMVDDVTEKDKTLPWKKRKSDALNHIKDMKHDSQMVKSADVLNNLTELTQDIEKDGEVVWKRFNASKKDTSTRYQLVISELEGVWADNPLIGDLRKTLRQLK